MRTDFEVGDLVRIRDWDDMVRSFGIEESGEIPVSDYADFVPEMKPLCGRICKITDIYPNDRIALDIPEGSIPEGNWIFTMTMIEHVVVDDKLSRIEEFEEPINPLIDF